MSSGTAGTSDRWPTTAAMPTVVAAEPPAHGLPTTGRRARERSRRRVRARSRRRVPIASITLVALAVIAAFLQLGENLDWWNIEVGAAVMTGLAVMVLATIVSAVVNRSLALIAITLLLTFALTGFAVAAVPAGTTVAVTVDVSMLALAEWDPATRQRVEPNLSDVTLEVGSFAHDPSAIHVDMAAR
jgi:hypothetical protein